MRAIRYTRHGDPEDVLTISDTDEPRPGPGQVRVRVAYCGLNPADWALCEGLYPGVLPRGIGLEVSGTVVDVGDEVPLDELGRAVFGPVPFDAPTAGAADLAVLTDWAGVPDGLPLRSAAALPMAGETAWRCLDGLEAGPDQLVLVHGAGSVIGGTAVRLALHRGARVIATAGPRHADALRAAGAQVTGYDDGMVERIEELARGKVDRTLDAAPAPWSTVQAPGSAGDGVLALLVAATGDPDRVLTMSRFAEAERLGVRVAPGAPRNDVLPEVARLAAAGIVDVPIAATYPLAEFGAAVRRSRSQRAGGKLLLAVSPA